MAVEVLPVYDVKGYCRLALAQQALGKYERALRAANKGIALQPSTQLSTIVEQLERQAAEQAAAPLAPACDAPRKLDPTSDAERKARVRAELAKLAVEREMRQQAQEPTVDVS
jgi:hypothetical protein